jgi:hypothetical protein
MVLSLDEGRSVALGKFNPHVISPMWLRKYGIRPEGDVDVRLAPLSDGAAFRYDLENKGWVEWETDPDSLQVVTNSSVFDCGRAVASVLELLPHTPIWGVENHFQFAGDRRQWNPQAAPQLGTVSLSEFGASEQIRWVGSFQRVDCRLNVTVGIEGESVAVLFTFFRPIEARLVAEASTPADQIAPARDAALCYEGDHKAARALLRSTFGVEVQNAVANI